MLIYEFMTLQTSVLWMLRFFPSKSARISRVHCMVLQRKRLISSKVDSKMSICPSVAPFFVLFVLDPYPDLIFFCLRTLTDSCSRTLLLSTLTCIPIYSPHATTLNVST